VLKAKKSKFFLLVLGSSLLVFYATYFPLPTEKDPLCLYSTHGRDDLRLVTLKAIKKAQHSIHIHTYALTDPQVLSLLMKKARAGVSVHITYHRKNTPRLEKLPYLHLHPEKGSGLMHTKWIIVDEILVLLGTANLTTSSLMMHENCLIGFFAPDFAKNLINPSFYQGKIGTQTITFFLLPDQKGLYYLLNTLDQAKSRVDVAQFTFTHPLLVQKLIELHQKDLSIGITLDQTGARGASKKAFETLLQAGLPVNVSQGIPLFHHKWALVDQSTLVLGSANWTQAAFNKNKDFILFLSPLKKKQVKQLKKMIQIINKESVTHKV